MTTFIPQIQMPYHSKQFQQQQEQQRQQKQPQQRHDQQVTTSHICYPPQVAAAVGGTQQQQCFFPPAISARSKNNKIHLSSSDTAITTAAANTNTMMFLQIENVSPDLSFIWRLYLMLRDSVDRFPDIVQWCHSGTAFEILDQKRLEAEVLGTYFNSGKYDSFARNLRGYGFTSLAKRTYAHESFRRDDPAACDAIVRFRGKRNVKSSSQSGQALAKAKAVGKATAPPARNITVTSSPIFSMNPFGPLTMLPTMMNVRQAMTATSPSLKSTSSSTATGSSSSSSASTPVNHPDTWSDHEGDNDSDGDIEPIALDDASYDDDFDPLPLSDDMPDLFHGKRVTHTTTQMQTQQQMQTFSRSTSRSTTMKNYVSPQHQKLLQDLEPRRVEEIAAQPKYTWLNVTPAMSPEINFFIEYLSPVTLPAGFRFMNLSRLGVTVGTVVVLVHFVECLLTNFGGKTWCWQPRLGRMQHHVMDQVINHGLISALLLLGPDHFGPAANICGIALCQTQPIFSVSTEKTHFNIFVRKNLKEAEEKILEGYLDKLIRNTFVWYQASFALLATWYCMDLGQQSLLLMAGLFLYNLVPLLSSTIYWRYIGCGDLAVELSTQKEKSE